MTDLAPSNLRSAGEEPERSRSAATSASDPPAGDRERRALLTVASSLVLKVISSASSVLAVSLTVRYLGVELYGVWATVSSAVAFLTFADFGLGNGLVVALSRSHGRRDTEAARRQVSTTMVLLTLVCCAVLVACAAVYAAVPWATIFNLHSPLAVSEAGPTALALIVCFALGLPLGVSVKVHLAYQEGLAANLWASSGALLGVIALWAAARAGAGLPVLVFALMGAPLVSSVAASVVQFGVLRPQIAPSLAAFDRSTARSLASQGGMFFTMTLLGAVGVSSDNLILAHHSGPSAVAGYSVLQRISGAANLAAYIAPAFWPAFGEATAREDYGWAQRAFNRVLAMCLVAGVGVSVPLMVVGKSIARLLGGEGVVPSTALLSAFAVSIVVQGLAGGLSSILNTGPFLARQAALYGAASVASLALKLTAVRVLDAPGIVWAGTVTTLLLYVVPGFAYARGTLRRLAGRGT